MKNEKEELKIADKLVIDYYHHNIKTLDELHDKLRKLFNSNKEAVEWFADNDERLRKENQKETNLLISSKYSVLVDRLEEVQKEIEEIKDLDVGNFPRFLNGDDLKYVIEDMKDVLIDRCNEVYNEKLPNEDEEEEM